jgi:hypothetical protein
MAIGTRISQLLYGTSPSIITEVKPTAEPTRADVKQGATKPQTKPPAIDPAVTVTSTASVRAYHSSLFRAFHLSADSTYNFYVDGEDVAPTSDVSSSLGSLPRYVTLRWHTAPTPKSRVPAQKGIRPFISPEVFQHPRAATMDVAVTALANGYVSPGTVSALVTDSPVPVTTMPTRIDEDSFLLSNTAAGKFAAAEVGDKSSEFALNQRSLAPIAATAVNFVDPSIAGTFDPNRLQVATDTLHLTVAGSLAKIIGSLEVISEFNQDVPIQNPPPDFTGHPDVPTVMYVGYVIERHDLLPDGSMRLGRVITIDDPTQDEFIDQRVSYGGSYVYRMRSIVQWTRTSDLDFAGLSTIDRVTSFSSLILPPLASFYAGDWCDWSRTQVLDTVPPDPPDEVTVRPLSWKGEIRVSWKVGSDPQRDITSFRLLRAISTAGRISDWDQLGEYVVANGSYIDRDVRPYDDGKVSYIYALYSTSIHGVDSPLSDQMEAKLSPIQYKEELPVVQAEVKGADRTLHPSGKQPPGPTEVKANRRLTFFCRSTSSGHPLRDSMYLIEVRSLSTGERALVALDVDATDIGVADA